jgi:hypothetical protein
LVVKLALDPYMLRNTTTLQSLPGVVADLGYEYIELSPVRISPLSSSTRAPTPTR